ncbi:hypothetical protein Taro_022192 [Colocasia esculenta]|uniref:Uncharacterized protein n=1 Tax=Colocasia esculenta TaxID=4460 RepID=A0A843UTQ7_COLES|nr:hypothetical protein [Colocasia esculenta]
MAKRFSPRRCEEEYKVAVWVKDSDFRKDHATSSCGVMIFLALGPSCSAKCECNRDEMMQKLVEENEILRKQV